MKKQLAEHLHVSERKNFLSDNCDSVEQMSYMKSFSPDELFELKERLVEVTLETSDLEHKKATYVSEINTYQKPLKKELVVLKKHLKEKAILADEDCYKFIDHELNEVGYYNAVGELVQLRPLLPSEKQTKLFSLKNGTNNG